MTGTPSEPSAAVEPLRRLHPSSLLFSLGAVARRLLIPGLVGLAASRGNRADIWLMVIFVPAAIGALAKYLSYRYRLGRDEMVVREGIVTRNERHIPYGRVQNIDLKQNPLHRLFGVAEVRLETASGDKPEAVIRVLSLPAVETMRQRVFAGRAAGVEQADGTVAERAGAGSEGRVLLRLPLRELLVLGLLSNRALALVAAAIGVLWQFAPDTLGDRIEELVRRATELWPALEAPDPVRTAALAIGGALIVLLLMKLLSLAWIVTRYYGFTLTRRGDDLRAEYGLLTHVSMTIPRHRIQLLSTVRGPLQRRLGRAALQVETAGGSEGDRGAAGDRLWLAPIIRDEALPALLAELFPGVAFETPDWRRIDPRAFGRIFRKGALLTLLLTGLLIPGFGAWGLLFVPVGIGLALARAAMIVRHTAYATPDGAVLYRSGWWSRRLSAVRCSKIQVLSMTQTPFDRRVRMARLQVDTAGAGRVGHPVSIPYLSLGVARQTYFHLLGATSRTTFRW